MRTMIGLTALLLVITTPTLGAGLYRCQEKDAVSLKDDGTLGRDKRWPSMRKRYENIIVDTATGTVHLGNDTPETWTVLGKGGLTTTSWLRLYLIMTRTKLHRTSSAFGLGKT
jgi:hypothetical protein